MSNITIFDTGFGEYTNSGTQWDQANSGTPLTLKSVEINFGITVNTATEVPLGNWNSSDLYGFYNCPMISTSAPIITISGLIDKSDSTDMAVCYKLIEFARSRGYKILYYNDTTDALESRELIYQLTKSGVGASAVGVEHIDVGSQYSTYEKTYPHIHVRFAGAVSLKQVPGTKFVRYNLPFVMIK